jgi:alpha-beta hydrolase superfamily lysophospholipase
MQDISVKAYPGGRHEMLNETNRDEVMRDLVTWLEQKL